MHPGSVRFGPRVLMRAALGSALLLLSACGSRGGDAAGAPSASLTVTTGAAETRRIALDVVASGSVAAWQEMSLGVELSGVRVERVLVEVGARVKKGQALVQLDTRSLVVDARRAEASYAQAAANLQLARASATRGETLLARQLISASNFEELSAGRSKAEAQLASAAAERDAARLKLAFATLRAPEAGIVASRTVQPGQIVSVGVELLRLIRDGRLEWRADLSEADLVRVRPGARVFVKSPDGTPIEGRIRAISPGFGRSA
jgi:RND family efflux transporter MFP subunit